MQLSYIGNVRNDICFHYTYADLIGILLYKMGNF
jgi:hypothetical protein